MERIERARGLTEGKRALWKWSSEGTPSLITTGENDLGPGFLSEENPATPHSRLGKRNLMPSSSLVLLSFGEEEVKPGCREGGAQCTCQVEKVSKKKES